MKYELVPLKWVKLTILGLAFYWCNSVIVYCTNLRLKCYTLNYCEWVIFKYFINYILLHKYKCGWLKCSLVVTWISFVFICVKEQFSTFDGEDHECALWLLLKRSQSEDKAIRLQAVQDLASNSHWHGNVCWCSLICPRNSTDSQLAVPSVLTIWRKASSYKKPKYALKLGLKCRGIIYISSSCSFLIP